VTIVDRDQLPLSWHSKQPRGDLKAGGSQILGYVKSSRISG